MSDMRHNQAQTKKEEEYAIKSMASIEKAARKAYEKDVAQAGGGAPPTESERKRRGKRTKKTWHRRWRCAPYRE